MTTHPNDRVFPTVPRTQAVDFLTALVRSGVLTDRQTEKVRDRVESGRYPREPRGLARRLVARGLLTEYQALRLLRGDRPTLVVGPYVVVGRLGRGSMGRVYRARHRLMGREVALKVISPDAACRRTAAARFRRETLLLARMDHPNVIRAFDAGVIGRDPYLVMEYFPARGLDHLIRERGHMPAAETLGYAAQAALGLAHAHARGVFHRDVKPSNLMVDDAGRLKVVDFGIGELAGPEDDGAAASRITGDGLSVGTVEYMSPERARGLAADGRSDLYSLGCVMYHLLAGRLPFPARTPLACLALRIAGPPAPLDGLRPDLPPALVAIVERLMALRPEDRYADASAAADAMFALLGKPDARGVSPS